MQLNWTNGDGINVSTMPIAHTTHIGIHGTPTFNDYYLLRRQQQRQPVARNPKPNVINSPKSDTNQKSNEIISFRINFLWVGGRRENQWAHDFRGSRLRISFSFTTHFRLCQYGVSFNNKYLSSLQRTPNGGRREMIFVRSKNKGRRKINNLRNDVHRLWHKIERRKNRIS